MRLPAVEEGRHTLEVTVSDGRGQEVTREWVLETEAAPLRLARRGPERVRLAFGESADLVADARGGSGDLRFEWSVDGRVAERNARGSFRTPRDLAEAR